MSVQIPMKNVPTEAQLMLQRDMKRDLLYGVDDKPPWSLSCLLGLQHYLTMFGATIAVPMILTPFLCLDDNNPARGYITCTIIFVSGLVTLLQSSIGNRLPIVQGGTFSFIVPTIAILTTNFEPCSNATHYNMSDTELEEVWQVRMREVQGAIAVSAIFQILVGFTGLIGFLMTWITPLAIAPTVTLVGLALFSTAAEKASLHWGISSMTIVVLILFSQYLRNVAVPVPTLRSGSGCTFTRLYLFKLFPVLMAILFCWGFCAILTATDVLPVGNRARTDATLDLLEKSPWFRVPYPGQWGLPTVSASAVFGMLAGVLASMIESVGDYYACARIAGIPPPPVHAINRGIGIEGIGCILAGLWGTGNGTTSYSENIGVIGVTKVSSRRVVQAGAVIMMLFGVLGKFGAAVVTIPEPVIGGVFVVMFSMTTAVGLSSLQHVDLTSSRNLFILGFAIFFGLALPKWLEENSGAIQTGSEVANQILTILLQTSMFVGGLIGFILDNTVPGTPKERGLLEWNAHLNPAYEDDDTKCYDLPFGMDAIRRLSWTRYFPVCPNFTGFYRRQSQGREV